MFSLIYARDSANGIGKNGSIPWGCKADMKFFKGVTTTHVVVMGRKTWDSLPVKHRPLRNRTNIILSRTLTPRKYNDAEHNADVVIVPNVEGVLRYTSALKVPRNLFVIGGAQIYKLFLDLGIVKELYVTTITGDHGCDTKLSVVPVNGISHDWVASNERAVSNIGQKYLKVNRSEEAFLHLLSNARSGVHRTSRTGVDTNSIFSGELRFNLRGGKIPMLTTRPLPLRHVFTELLWFLRGSTDVQWLRDRKIHIWDANANKEFLKKYNLPYAEWDIGPSYGFQMRYSGAKYIDCKTNYTGQGVDQLQNAIDLIKNNPSSRRIIINLWNVADVADMALPPCAFCYQFYVAGGYLSCKLMQRSSDIALAGGWNITTVSLLTILMASVCGLKPGEVIWSPNDIHVYHNQLDAVDTQLKRTPKPFPLLSIVAPKSGDITDFKFSDLTLSCYEPEKRIKIAMNA